LKEAGERVASEGGVQKITILELTAALSLPISQCWLKRRAHPLALERLDADAIMQAMIASFNGNEAPLAQLIRALLQSQNGI
jgi:hypothetical protein